jgi:hypothetical protein
MEEQIISSVFKREMWDPKNPSHKNVNILHKLWLEIAVGKDGK